MRILMISVNKEKSIRPVLPVGMAIIAAQLRHAGQHVKCIDLCFETDDERAVREGILDENPELIGISVRNVDSQSFLEPTFHLPFLLQVVRWCRDYAPHAPVLLGGPGFSQAPTEIMRYTRADYGIAGPGEHSAPQLLKSLEYGESLDGIPGLLHWGDADELCQIPPDYIVDFPNTVPPDRKDYDQRYFTFGFQTHSNDMRCVEPVQTKKGCALKCICCSNFKVDGPRVVLKPVADTVDEIEAIATRGGEGFEFVDGVFNLPLRHALDVCREMKQRGITIPWSCQLNPGAVTPELADLMTETGCHHVEFGTDSGSDHILARLRKNFNRYQVIKAHQLVAERGMEVIHCIFIGSPGEERETVRDTLSLMGQLVPPDAPAGYQAYFSLGLRICEGSELHRIAFDEGMISTDDALGVPRFYLCPEVAEDDELLAEIEHAVVTNPNWYLWWGLPNYSLRERINQIKLHNRKVEQLYLETIQRRDTDNAR